MLNKFYSDFPRVTSDFGRNESTNELSRVGCEVNGNKYRAAV